MFPVQDMRFRRKKSEQTEEFGDQKAARQEFVTEKKNGTREARYRIFSCAFCEFVRDNLNETDLGESPDDDEGCSSTSGVFEAKFLYHLMSVHGLKR